MALDQDAASVLQGWIGRLEAALASGSASRVADLFAADGYWRDVLAFTWTLKTFAGPREIGAELVRLAADVRPKGFRINPAYPAQRKTWIGREVVEGMFGFQTAQGRATLVVRLLEGEGDARAWAMSTVLDELTGFEEQSGDRRPRNTPSLSTIGGENWLDRRLKTMAFEDREPAVLIVGGGQAGISVAARLNALGVDTLVVDRMTRVGDNWRNRYYAMTLHNEICTNDLPYIPFPQTWPQYIPKDKLADWFEFYVSAMEINFWTSTEFEGAAYDAAEGRWNATVRKDGKTRVLHPRHVVLSIGVSGQPQIPQIEGLEDYKGQILHSADYAEKAPFKDRDVIVFGTGNSAHDVAQDVYAAARSVTMIQKGPTMVVNCEPSAQLPNMAYRSALPVELIDKANVHTPYPLVRMGSKLGTAQMIALDKELTEGLEAAGFRTFWGDDDTGYQILYFERGGGYYFNVGCSNLIIDGKIRVVQFDDISGFAAKGVILDDGTTLPADAIIMATGFRDLQHFVRQKFGDRIADAVGPIWGYDENGELRNVWRRTAQPGLWIGAGSLPQARYMSNVLALQIKASEEGLIRTTELQRSELAAE